MRIMLVPSGSWINTHYMQEPTTILKRCDIYRFEGKLPGVSVRVIRLVKERRSVNETNLFIRTSENLQSWSKNHLILSQISTRLIYRGPNCASIMLKCSIWGGLQQYNLFYLRRPQKWQHVLFGFWKEIKCD